MAELTVLALQLTAIWSGLLVPCMQPENIQACTTDWDVWLYPELVRAWELKAGIEVPYSRAVLD